MTVPTEDIAAAIRARRDWAMGALEGWVRCPSVLGEERSAQEHLAGLLEELGWEPELRDVDAVALRDHPNFSPVDWSYEGRPNLVATHQPREVKGRSLVFNGHVDVVSPEPVQLWSTPPFEPRRVEEDGEVWIQGRGAADMKGGSVCHLWALAALQDAGYRPAARVSVQSPIEEECTGNGTLALLVDAPPSDACVIPEPFDEALMIDEVGVMWFQVRVLGSTTHVLQAGAGVNAIEKSWVIIQALRALEEDMNRPENRPEAYREVEHPFNLNVGVIRGGDWASTVAGECMVRFRIGFSPDQSCQQVRARIEQVVAEAAARDPWLKNSPPAVEYVGHQAEGSRLDPESELVTTLARLHARLHGAEPARLYSTCTTDVRHFLNLHQTPATCYGPVGRLYHSADERVSVDSMQRVATTMAEFVQEWCGLERC